MNTRYRIRFERSGYYYRKQYAATKERARAIVWSRYARDGSSRRHLDYAPRRAIIEGTRDEPCPGRKPRWDTVEEYK